jgi:hypothetical protein
MLLKEHCESKQNVDLPLNSLGGSGSSIGAFMDFIVDKI